MTLLDNLKLVVGDEERILMLNWYHDIVNSVVPDFPVSHRTAREE